MDPYCFAVSVDRGYEVRVSYVVSGLNEDQVEFRAYFIESNEELYNIKDRRDGDILLRTYKAGKVNLCWRKLDRKSKKLSFSIAVVET